MLKNAFLYQVKIPMKRARGHALATRTAAESLVTVFETNENFCMGECVPREYVTGETYETVWNAITNSNPDQIFKQINFSDPKSVIKTVEDLNLPEYLKGKVQGLAAGCLIELAILDLAAKQFKMPLREFANHMGLPESMISQAPIEKDLVSITVDFLSEPENVVDFSKEYIAHLKIKVGAGLEKDTIRVKKCREYFGNEMPISVDANMAWTVDEAVAAYKALAPYHIDWFEEPLKKSERDQYRRLRELSGGKVMLDEGACSVEQVRNAIENKWCDLINIRLSKCGGFLAGLRLAEMANLNNIGYQLGVQVGQVGVLNAAGSHFSSIVKNIQSCEGAYGLENLVDRITVENFKINWPLQKMTGLSQHGLGIEPDFKKLDEYSIRKSIWNGRNWQEVGV